MIYWQLFLNNNNNNKSCQLKTCKSQVYTRKDKSNISQIVSLLFDIDFLKQFFFAYIEITKFKVDQKYILIIYVQIFIWILINDILKTFFNEKKCMQRYKSLSYDSALDTLSSSIDVILSYYALKERKDKKMDRNVEKLPRNCLTCSVEKVEIRNKDFLFYLNLKDKKISFLRILIV